MNGESTPQLPSMLRLSTLISRMISILAAATRLFCDTPGAAYSLFIAKPRIKDPSAENDYLNLRRASLLLNDPRVLKEPGEPFNLLASQKLGRWVGEAS